MMFLSALTPARSSLPQRKRYIFNLGKDSINKISELVEEEVCIEGRVLEDIGDVMLWGVLVLTVQDCPDCHPLLVIPAAVMSRARCD
ncbi:MAG: hypothetical protein ACTSPE_13295 [Candidatus Thorarchaeota archaeon]